MNNVRAAIKNYDGYVYIPDLKAHMAIEVKQPNNLVGHSNVFTNSEKVISSNILSEQAETIPTSLSFQGN